MMKGHLFLLQLDSRNVLVYKIRTKPARCSHVCGDQKVVIHPKITDSDKKADDSHGSHTVARGVYNGSMISSDHLGLSSGQRRVHVDQV